MFFGLKYVMARHLRRKAAKRKSHTSRSMLSNGGRRRGVIRSMLPAVSGATIPFGMAALPVSLFRRAVPARDKMGEVLNLLGIWRGASFADLIQQTGFGEPGKGAPHGHEDTGFAAHA
jgi:hypothetical protein